VGSFARVAAGGQVGGDVGCGEDATGTRIGRALDEIAAEIGVGQYVARARVRAS
jgi:hypothetical protein